MLAFPYTVFPIHWGPCRWAKICRAGIDINNDHVAALFYADDIVLSAHNEESLQLELDNWCRTWDISINIFKTKVMHFHKEHISKQPAWILAWLSIFFSSAIYHPLIKITPGHFRAPIPLYLAFNQYGAGIYDGVTLSSTSRRPHSVTSLIQWAQWSCGEKMTKWQNTLQPQAMKHTSVTRCQCYKEQKASTPFYKCKNCSNPFGNNLPASNPMPSRKWPRQQWQCNVPKVPASL